MTYTFAAKGINLLVLARRNYHDACESLSLALQVGDSELIAEALTWKLQACLELTKERNKVS